MPVLALLNSMECVTKSWFVSAFVRCLAYQLGGKGISTGTCCERKKVAEIRDNRGEYCPKLRLSDQARNFKPYVDLCRHLVEPAALNPLTMVSVSYPWSHVLVTNSRFFSSSKMSSVKDRVSPLTSSAVSFFLCSKSCGSGSHSVGGVRGGTNEKHMLNSIGNANILVSAG